jgi:hypothetical protein
MDVISKEELKAFTEAHEKTATVLEKIAGQLESITVTQNKLVDSLTNGIADKIIEGVTKNYNSVHKETIESLKRLEECSKEVPVKIKESFDNTSMAKDISFTKWFVGIVGAVVIVATIILRGIDNRSIMNKENIQIIKTLAEELKKPNVQILP